VAPVRRLGPYRWLPACRIVTGSPAQVGVTWRLDAPDGTAMLIPAAACPRWYPYSSEACPADCARLSMRTSPTTSTITLGVYSHLCPKAEARTRAAAGDRMAAALGARAVSLRTETL
jgi:hypothetical protein